MLSLTMIDPHLQNKVKKQDQRTIYLLQNVHFQQKIKSLTPYVNKHTVYISLVIRRWYFQTFCDVVGICSLEYLLSKVLLFSRALDFKKADSWGMDCITDNMWWIIIKLITKALYTLSIYFWLFILSVNELNSDQEGKLESNDQYFLLQKQ